MRRNHRKHKGRLKAVVGHSWQLVATSVILGILFFIVVSFYVFSSVVSLNSFIVAFLLVSLLTDGLFVVIHISRKRRQRRVYFHPYKLTIVIACYNGEDVIGETIDSALKHVPPDQVIVVSDASTDRTAEIARGKGVRVIVNSVNMSKVRSINEAIPHVHTPYVLVMDDDMLISDTVLPTNLLDEGYSAVAFNVMPKKEDGLINELQRYEYRVSMQVGKHLRASKGAIGNVSGAIGMFRTEDLAKQIKLHSGQFAGEDEQRTLLAHLYGEGRGVTYTDSLAITHAPHTWKQLYRQRAYSWSTSVPELFVIYWQVLLSPKFHFLLKAEKAYLVYVYVTDPLRILFIWTLFLRPTNLIVAYVFYFALNVIIWMRLGCKDNFKTVALMPIYSIFLTLCRFIGHFYWLKEKGRYIAKGLHKFATGRLLLVEYGITFLVIIATWAISIEHFLADMNLFDKIRNDQLSSNEDTFNYDTGLAPANITVPPGANYVLVQAVQGDNSRAVAHRAVDIFLNEQPQYFDILNNDDKRWKIDALVQAGLSSSQIYANSPVRVSKDSIQKAIDLVGAQ